jgi:hypothetical protein
MAQYYQTREQANAELIAAAITEIGRAMGKSMEVLMAMKAEDRKLSEKSLAKLETFMKLPPEKRKMLLDDPSFRSQFVSVLEPDIEAYSGKRRKAALERAKRPDRIETMMQLAAPTGAEKAATEKAAAELEKTQAEARKETALGGKAVVEERMAGLKERLATGVEAPTPMNLLFAGDIKDPIAAAMFSLIPQEQLKNIALADKKQGPIYQQAQQQEWFKWGIAEGFSPALAMKYGMHIAAGEWDKLPLKDPMTGQPVRAKAERELATQQMNAQSTRMSVNNTLESSIATATVELASKAAIPLEQARADIVAMRQGKPLPFPLASEHLMHIATLDETLKGQAVEKNRVELMKNKSGIAEITSSLTSLIEANKKGWGASSGQMKKDIDGLIENLTTKTMEMYGVPREHYASWRESIMGVMGSVWSGLKPAVVMGDLLKGDLEKYLKSPEMKQFASTPLMKELLPELGDVVGKPKSPTKLDPNQEGVLKNLYKSLTGVLQDPNTPDENKKFIMSFIKDKLEPIRKGEASFLDLIGAGQTAGAPAPPAPPAPAAPAAPSWLQSPAVQEFFPEISDMFRPSRGGQGMPDISNPNTFVGPTTLTGIPANDPFSRTFTEPPDLRPRE